MLTVAKITSLLVFGLAIGAEYEEREWHDVQGRSLVGTYVRQKAGRVTLKSNGSVVTVPIERFSQADRDYLQLQEENEAQPIGDRLKGRTTPPDLNRVWTDNQGRKLRATFVRVHLDQIILAGTTTQSVPFASLSVDDQQFLRDYLASKGQANLLPKSSLPETAQQIAGVTNEAANLTPRNITPASDSAANNTKYPNPTESASSNTSPVEKSELPNPSEPTYFAPSPGITQPNSDVAASYPPPVVPAPIAPAPVAPPPVEVPILFPRNQPPVVNHVPEPMTSGSNTETEVSPGDVGLMAKLVFKVFLALGGLGATGMGVSRWFGSDEQRCDY
jgi:hypothetical protein